MGWTLQGPASFLKKIKKIARNFAEDRILITLEGGYEIEKQARAVYNCLRVLNDEEGNLILEKIRTSEPLLLDYVNTKLIPALKNNLRPYWNCF